MKIAIITLILTIASPVFAMNPIGTGYNVGLCPTKHKDKNGHTIMTRCVKLDYNPMGLQIDLGIPSGLGFSLIGKPVKFLELSLGGVTELTGGGIKAGAMVFLPWYVSPGLSIEGGKMWAGDINKLPTLFGAANPNISLLNNVQYSFGSLLGSLGFGNKWFMFRLYAGYSLITAQSHGLQAFLRNETGENDLTSKEVHGKLFSPTGKLSMTIYWP